MAGRKRHAAEDIVRKLRRADGLAAEGKTGEEIAAELGVSAAGWRPAPRTASGSGRPGGRSLSWRLSARPQRHCVSAT
jgi:putative transposase